MIIDIERRSFGIWILVILAHQIVAFLVMPSALE